MGVGAGPPPLESHKAIGFLSRTGLDPWKIAKLPGQHLKLGHYQPASETSLNAGGPMMAHFKLHFDHWIPPHQVLKKRFQSWAPSDKTFWMRACLINYT